MCSELLQNHITSGTDNTEHQGFFFLPEVGACLIKVTPDREY